MNIFPPRIDEHKQKLVPTATPTRYHRLLSYGERERLDLILEKRLEVSFLSNKGHVSKSSYSLKNLQDWLIQKVSVWSSQAEIFLVGSVASSVLQETHGFKDIDLRVMLPQAIVDTSKSDVIVSYFLQGYAPKTKTRSWRPIYQTHTAPDLTSCTYQMEGVDLNFRARVAACLSVNRSDGFAIRLSDRHIFCIDQRNYCSTQTAFEEGYRQLAEQIYPITHFQHLRGIEFRVLKKATLGYYIQETTYFKAFPGRIRADYYLTDSSGKIVEGWQGRKEWLTSYKNHLQTDYPISIQGNERVRVCLLDILNLLSCMDEKSSVFAEKLASIWGACLPGIRGSLTSPLYFLERYPADITYFLQLLQALVCCHHTYCMHQGRAILKSHENSYGLLLRRGEALLTIQDIKEGFSASFDHVASLVQHNAQLLSSLQSLFCTLGLPNIAWTEASKSRYVLLLSWQADDSAQKPSSAEISLLKETFFHPNAVARWSKEQYWSFLGLLTSLWIQPFLPTLVAQPEIGKTIEEALSAHKHIQTTYHQLIRTIGIVLKHSTISTLPTLQLMREILADPLLEEAQHVQAAVCDMTKILDIPLVTQSPHATIKRMRMPSPRIVPPKQWRISLRRIQACFASLQNLRHPLQVASEEIQKLTHQAQKSRWIYQKEQNVILKKLVSFHLQVRHHEEVSPFQTFTYLLQERVQIYAQRKHEKEYLYWQSLCTAVATQCITLQMGSLPFLKAPQHRLFYILQTPTSIQRILCIALQTNTPYSSEESQALLQICMKAPRAFIPLKTQEDLLDLGDFIVDQYPLTLAHEELYKTFSQLITLFFGQPQHSLQDLAYRLFSSLPATPHLQTQPLRKAWTQQAKMAFSFLVKMGEYGQLSRVIPPIYAQLDYNHCFSLTLHLQDLAVAFHLQLFSQLAETTLSRNKYANGCIPFPDTQSWSPTSLVLHRLIQRLNDGIVLYEMYPALLRNAVDLIAGLLIRTPDHSFELLNDGYTTLDKLYQLQKDYGRPAEELSWYPKYNFSFAIHVHHLAAASKNLSPLEGLAPRLAAIVPSFIAEMSQEDIASFIQSNLFFLRDFALLSLIKDDPNIFISFLDRTIKPFLEQLRTSSLPSFFFLSMSKSLGEMCIDLFFLDMTIDSIPQIFFPSTRAFSNLLFSPQKPKLTSLKKKLESKLAFSIIKDVICAPPKIINNKNLVFIGDAIRFYAYSKQYNNTSCTNMKILVHLYKTIFTLFNQVAREEDLDILRQLWEDVSFNLQVNLTKTGNTTVSQELQKIAAQCPRLTAGRLVSKTDSIRAAIAKSPRVKRPTL